MVSVLTITLTIFHAMHAYVRHTAAISPVVAQSTLYSLLHMLHARAAIINQTPYVINIDGHP